MSTGTLSRPSTGRLPRIARALRPAGMPVPSFSAAFPPPPGFGHGHPLYEMHRAANRVYRERLREYRERAGRMTPPELVAYIREDVASNLLATVAWHVGPVELRAYRFLNPRKLWAWLPPHRRRAEAALWEFKQLYKPRRRTL